ncbi:MAG TPA: hypothetical protein DEB40_03260 [Elusimicrobia bacterium]|nr:hypothetical protein [Elusimicrobiota bacterium]HBT60749.1 hypothetical protein [Elusimicrobiota bacterium]
MNWETENRKQQTLLEQELRSESYIALLLQLRHDESIFRRFETWGEVIALMREGGLSDAEKDQVLRPILRIHRSDQDPRWRTIMLVMFWPALRAIHWQKRAWDADIAERWQAVSWTFLKILCRIDFDRRPDRIAQKLFNDTAHHLYLDYKRKWSASDKEVAMDPEELTALGTDDIDYAGIELRLTQAAEIRRLRAHLEAGRINEPDFLLLVGTRVYGKTAAQYARETGMDCALARQRRFRAEATIHRHERAG